MKDLSFDAGDPSSITTSRYNWFMSLNHGNVVPMTITYQPWYNILQVQNVVNALPANQRALFRPTPVVDETFRRYDESRILLARAEASLKVAQGWACVTDNPANQGFRDDLQSMRDRFSGEIGALEQMTELDMRAIQINGELDTWFRGQGIIDEYVDLVRPKMQECDIELTCERCAYGAKCDRVGLRCNAWPSGNYHCRLGPWATTSCPVGESCARYLDDLFYFPPATNATPCVL
jgi:hypothetical protein